MRSICLFLLTAFTASAFAGPAADFVQAYPSMNELRRAAGAYAVCQEVFHLPEPEYALQVKEMGQWWHVQPEGAYYLISTCQSLWITQYFDPVRTLDEYRKLTGAEVAYKIAALDLVGATRALREEVRLYNEVAVTRIPGTPAAPYEILSGMASSERELDETMHRNVAMAITALTAAGSGAAITILKGTSTFARIAATGGRMTAMTGTGIAAAAAICVLSYGVGQAADYGIWWIRERRLWIASAEAQIQLEQNLNGVPLPLALDQFYKSVERLAYFYSYNLYLVESGKSDLAEVNPKCYKKLINFFRDPGTDWSEKFKRGRVCGDAAAVFAGASQYLTKLYPNDPQVRLLATRMMDRAKRTYWSYIETERYKSASGIAKPWPF